MHNRPVLKGPPMCPPCSWQTTAKTGWTTRNITGAFAAGLGTLLMNRLVGLLDCFCWLLGPFGVEHQQRATRYSYREGPNTGTGAFAFLIEHSAMQLCKSLMRCAVASSQMEREMERDSEPGSSCPLITLAQARADRRQTETRKARQQQQQQQHHLKVKVCVWVKNAEGATWHEI
ncbi:hypothetical protein B0T17DRAFT_508063 [Bombardia bombarda]|uniref:Uncharacterized protein n=1 Tax=Bombardia bombarda TaxID=252184 RepID=A0AA40C5I4_9PEZI|nr:hypothetical protein B0T17DRAFT_508063 [Bombardia bombarda]